MGGLERLPTQSVHSFIFHELDDFLDVALIDSFINNCRRSFGDIEI
jgi:hypothetical protein